MTMISEEDRKNSFKLFPDKQYDLDREILIATVGHYYGVELLSSDKVFKRPSYIAIIQITNKVEEFLDKYPAVGYELACSIVLDQEIDNYVEEDK